MSGPITPWGQVPAGRYELYADDDDVIGLTVATTYPSGWPIVRTDPPFMDACDEFAIGQFIAAALTNAATEGDQLAELRAVLAKYDDLPMLDLDADEDAEMEWHLDHDAASSRIVSAARRLLASHPGGEA